MISFCPSLHNAFINCYVECPVSTFPVCAQNFHIALPVALGPGAKQQPTEVGK